MPESQLVFHPIISSIQRILLYESKARYFLIGSNNTQTRFRVLKIDRTDPRELILVDDKVEYNKQEIRQLFEMIESGNRSSRGGLTKVVSAFGIVGFVRFLEGYYIVLVTKRTRVAVIGYHSIYKIQDTCTIYIPSDLSKPHHPDEQRYLKMFQALDLSTNFYYSYSYDLTHSLQINMAPPRQLTPAELCSMGEPAPDDELCHCRVGDPCGSGVDQEDLFETWKSRLRYRFETSGQKQTLEFGIRTVPQWRFVWNNHLLSAVHSQLHPDWLLYITHGFVEQSSMSIFGRSIYVTLIARRSNRYAGTRFLKRGANCCGDVANEVETEQIVHDSMVSSFTAGRYSSFVQLRGSVPGHWSQDISKMVPKPTITVDLSDPYSEVAAKHFNDMFRRYGSPLIILNLVKKREKKKHETFLTEELITAVKYLNQFLPPEHNIQYYHIDMARMNKGADSKVLDKLTSIARMVVKKTGIFLSTCSQGEKLGLEGHQRGRLQTGIVRVNCVDCLDRTNTAQFAIGKCILGYQLCALGLLENPVLEFDSDCIRLLESLYEDHGDTLALQYGGSQLVHRIKTYRKTAPWSSHGNDIMQTLSRYYSNTFSDAEKQNTINLFLGLFIPDPMKPTLWEAPNDYYLHHKEAARFTPHPNRSKYSLTKWWDDSIVRCLPLSYNEMRKSCCEVVGVSAGEASLEMIDIYQDYHKPYEYSVLADWFGLTIVNSLRDIAPPNVQNYSPFVVRSRTMMSQGKSGIPNSKNPALTGRSSVSSNNSSDSNNDSSSDEDITSSVTSTRQVSPSPVKATKQSEELEEEDTLFKPIKRVERIKLTEPLKADMTMYKRYVKFDRKSNKVKNIMGSINLTVSSAFSIDSTTCVIPPTVSKAAKEIYRQYVDKKHGAKEPSKATLSMFEKYVNFSF